LLIVKILKDDEIKRFLETAKSLGMQCIVEINDKEEFDRIKDFKTKNPSVSIISLLTSSGVLFFTIF